MGINQLGTLLLVLGYLLHPHFRVSAYAIECDWTNQGLMGCMARIIGRRNRKDGEAASADKDEVDTASLILYESYRAWSLLGINKIIPDPR